MKLKVSGLKELKKAAQWVRTIPDTAQRAAVAAVNRSALELRKLATDEMQGRVNLPASYVRGKLRVVKATASNPVGLIAIRRRAVRLARFGAQQLSASAPRAKGDASRGIAKGRKQAGVSVQVSKGRKMMRSAFLVPLLSGNGMGVFVRTGPDRKNIEHLYGPSPDQIFRAWRDDNLRRVQDTLVANFDIEFRRAMKKERR